MIVHMSQETATERAVMIQSQESVMNTLSDDRIKLSMSGADKAVSGYLGQWMKMLLKWELVHDVDL